MTVKSKELTEQGLIDLAGVKVYIAGPMSGLAMLNRPAFFAAEAYLQRKGARVMNPAVLPDGWDHDAYMRITTPMMMECDAVAFLPREGANRPGNSSRLTQSFHFFLFEPIFSPVNALNQPI
ncbi:DUF4406 domain-containing protein [Aeromonas veronii]